MHKFPYKIQNPATKERVEIKDDEDIKKMFITFLEYKSKYNAATVYTFARLSICFYRLREQWVEDMLERYNYCKRWNTQPYSGSFDDQPAVWKEVSRFIDHQVNALSDCQCAEHNPQPKAKHG